MQAPETYWKSIWNQFRKRWLGYVAFYLVVLYVFVGLIAPFLASSKPFWVFYDGQWYFPLFRYLFYSGFYTKRLDIFFNLLIFTLPLAWLSWYLLKDFSFAKMGVILGFAIIQTLLFFNFALGTPKDPAA